MVLMCRTLGPSLPPSILLALHLAKSEACSDICFGLDLQTIVPTRLHALLVPLFFQRLDSNTSADEETFI